MAMKNVVNHSSDAGSRSPASKAMKPRDWRVGEIGGGMFALVVVVRIMVDLPLRVVDEVAGGKM